MTKPAPKTILICVALFFFFVLVQFPFKNFRGKIFEQIYRGSGILMTADDMGLSFFGWPGISFTNLNVDVQSAGFRIGAKEAVVRVGIGQLWPPALSYSGSLDEVSTGGDLWFRFVDGGNAYRIGAELTKFDGKAITFYQTPAPISGPISGDIDLGLNFKQPSESSGYVRLEGKNLVLQPQNYPPYFSISEPTKFGPGKIIINISNGVAEIVEFQFGDGKSDMTIKLTGQLKLEPNFYQSHLKLRLDIQMSDAFANSQNARDLKGYLSTFLLSNGSYAMQWDKTLAQLTDMGSFGPLPQPIPR
ncbi:MAG: type II secretion system protein GspN [Planctomycetales bacterium]|nr:type II secretion system protein GspN [Planctomycetales bacterium]